MKTKLVVTATSVVLGVVASTFTSRAAGTICAGAATLNNGSIVTIGQPFVGLMRAGDNSVTVQAGIIPVLVQGELPSVPPQISPRMSLVNGRFQLTFSTQTGRNYVVQASTNLVDWMPIWTNAALGESMLFEDPETTNFDRRFYRVVAP